MVTSVQLMMMMMMTIFALSLVEFVQCNTCKVNGQNSDWYCPGSEPCFFKPGGQIGCCASGNKPQGVAGCCPTNSAPYKKAGCCTSGSNPHGTAVCCPSNYPQSYIVAGCCPTGHEPFTTQDGKVGCCSPGYRPWQFDDGYMTCCQNGYTCTRTTKDHPEPNYKRIQPSEQHAESFIQEPFVPDSIEMGHFIDHEEE